MSGVSITGLNPASTLTGSEIVPIVQSGTTVRTTLAAMPYVPAGTGAVTTSVQAKLRETVSVKDFGAVGDGVTDDTTAIQAALNSGNKNIYVPAGTYNISNNLTLIDGTSILGNGYSSFIQQTTVNKDGFTLANNCAIENLRIKITDGNDTQLVSCIYAQSVNNPTVQNCWIQPGDKGGCGVQIRNCKQTVIRNNRIYGGQWSTLGASSASAADILLYSSAASERHLITGNFCLSNNSQGIFVAALGYDADIVISDNVCVTLDTTTCTPTGAWSLAATGGNRRHGIIAEYNASSVNGPRMIIENNICRNTRWTGIYQPNTATGAVLISNNLCDLNGYDGTTSLTGGIYITTSSGFESVVGNTITNFQSTVSGTGAIVISQAGSNPILISNNTIKDSLGYGISIVNSAKNTKVSNNLLSNNAKTDIWIVASAGSADRGNNIIDANYIYRTTGTEPAVYINNQTGTLANYIINNRIKGYDNTTASTSNTAVKVANSTDYSYVIVENNVIEMFYYGLHSDAYATTNRSAVIKNNIVKDCNTGFAIGAATNYQSIPLINNNFVNVTTSSGAALGGYATGKIVQQIGSNFNFQSTASPTTGTWLIGDRAFNSSPAAGQPKSWVCTVSGTAGTSAGTWVSEGNL